jgi:hypothetical protein
MGGNELDNARCLQSGRREAVTTTCADVCLCWHVSAVCCSTTDSRDNHMVVVCSGMCRGGCVYDMC